MRRKMTKEVTKTTVSLARMTVQDGKPVAEELESLILLGNVSQEKAQKDVSKKFDFPVTVIGVQADTTVYEMDVEKFIELADVKVDAENEAE